MRSLMIFKRTLGFLLVSISANLTQAAIRPSFMLDSSTWDATDVVLATETGLADGKVTVLETWKGSLVAKDALVVADLHRFADKQNRAVSTSVWIKKNTSEPPVVVSGKRMILFLKRAPSQPAKQETAKISWEPAGFFRAIEVSVVWVEGQKSYSFIQAENPGPSLLMPIDYSKAVMKERVAKIVQTQECLARIERIPAPTERATEVAAYFSSDIYGARNEAFSIIVGCKRSAVPILRKMLAERPTSGASVIDALAAAGGSDLAPEFVQLLDRELPFWKSKAPSLQQGWWNGRGLPWSEVESLRDRYCRVESLLRGLRKMRYQKSRSSVQAFRDYWRSLPQLDDSSGLNQISQACDEVLQALESNESSSR
jgi:hypothetical protein